MCMYFSFMHNQGEGVHPYKHGPCAMIGVLVAKWIHAITTSAKHDVPWTIWKNSNSAFNALHWLASARCLSFGSSLSSGFTLSACQCISFASLGSTKYRYRRGVIGKYHTTFCGAFFLAFLYREALHFGQMVFSACSFRYMMQALMHV